MSKILFQHFSAPLNVPTKISPEKFFVFNIIIVKNELRDLQCFNLATAAVHELRNSEKPSEQKKREPNCFKRLVRGFMLLFNGPWQMKLIVFKSKFLH